MLVGTTGENQCRQGKWIKRRLLSARQLVAEGALLPSL